MDIEIYTVSELEWKENDNEQKIVDGNEHQPARSRKKI